MRIARQPGLPSFFETLKKTDATRAPLHPLILSLWIAKFGDGEHAARSLSGVCGVVTCLGIFAIGKRLGGYPAAFWSAFFASVSPLLIEYDREARMYAMLTMLSTLAWWNLLRFRDGFSRGRLGLQTILQVGLAYVHPLGLLMLAALALGWAVDRRRTFLGMRNWFLIQAMTVAAVVPWIGQYFDHKPEFLTENQSIRLLLGMPIGFTGGNSRTFLLFATLVVIGLVPYAIPALCKPGRSPSSGPIVIAAWLAVPPLLLFVYSRLVNPIFGPARYHVDVAPAYLILIGVGLGRLKWFHAALIGTSLLLFVTLPEGLAASRSSHKADWRAATEWLDTRFPGSPVVIVSPQPGRLFEYDVARYYLGPLRRVRPYSEGGHNPSRDDETGSPVLYVTAVRDDLPARAVPRELEGGLLASGFNGLKVYVRNRSGPFDRRR